MKISIPSEKKWRISPYLNMQFMEPLSVTDSSVDAGWDYLHGRWHDDLIAIVRDLAPGMVRWGGCFASYYHWYEGVGPSRRPMLNLCWDGVYSNAVGTKEVVDFCRLVNAEPLMVMNMESDGRMKWAYPENGDVRLGTAEEAAGWIRYCNDPDDKLRRSHDPRGPYNIRWWQIGNETSYDKNGYSLKEAISSTLRFANAAHEADPSVNLIAWGDSGWAKDMCEAVGDRISHIAFHCHYGSALEGSPLSDTEYRRDPAKTWEHILSASSILDDAIRGMKEQVRPYGKRLAMTEGHFTLRGRNRCDVLSTWMAGAAYARNHNVIMRGSDMLDIATMADFFGSRWQVNAVMLPTPRRSGRPYLQPVGQVMRLFGRYCGEHYLGSHVTPEADIVITATGDTVYLHAVNLNMYSSVEIEIDAPVGVMKVREIAPEDPMTEITPQNSGCFDPVEKTVTGNKYILPAAGIAAAEFKLPAKQ